MVIVILISPCSMDTGKPKQWWWPCKTRSEPAMCWTPMSMDSQLPSSQVAMDYKAEIYVVSECWALSDVLWSQCMMHMLIWHSILCYLIFPATILFLHKKSFAVSYLKALLMSLWRAISEWFFCLDYDSLFFSLRCYCLDSCFFPRGNKI